MSTAADPAALTRRLTAARLEAAALVAERHARRLRESSALASDWTGPWGQLLQQQQGDPGWLPVGGTGARRYGAHFPFYQTEQQHGIIRDLGRLTVGTNNHAWGMLRGLRSFVIGTGHKFKTAGRLADQKQGARQAKRLTEWLDVWARRVRWYERQRELFWRTHRDGDALLRQFPSDGWLALRHVWPEQLTQPPEYSFEEYGFGVKCDPDDADAVEGYYFARLGVEGGGDFVEPADVLHLKANVDTGVKRGLSDFSFGTKDVLDSAATLTRNLGEGSAVRAAIAYLREHAAATEAEVTAFADGQADFRERTPFRDEYRPVGHLPPGTVIDIPEGMTHVGAPADPGTAAHTGVVALLLRSAGVRWNAPEWLVSGDASNMGAFTSSLVAESPFVRGVQEAQDYYRVRFLEVVERAVGCAVAHGLLPRDVADAVTLDLVPPTPEVRDKDKEAGRAQTEVTLGVQSRQNYCSEQGRDFDRIAQDNQQYQETYGKDGESGAQGQQQPDPTADPFGGALAEAMELPAAVGRVLREHGFTGEITDKAGHHRTYRDGKQVAGHHDAGGGGGGHGGDGGDAAAGAGKRGLAGRAAGAAAAAGGKVVAGLGWLEHHLKDLVVAGHDRLPNGVRAVTAAAFRLGMTGFDAGQDAAVAAGRARGVPEERLAKLGHLCAFLDVAAFKVTKFAALAHVPFGHAAFAVCGTLPVASLAYLGYSTARDPIASAKAAVVAVKASVKRTGWKVVADFERDDPGLAHLVRARAKKAGLVESLEDAGDADTGMGRLLDALAAADDDRADWLLACYAAALAHADGDRDAAADLALHAAETDPPAGDEDDRAAADDQEDDDDLPLAEELDDGEGDGEHLRALLEADEPRLTADEFAAALASGRVLIEAEGAGKVAKKITVTMKNGKTYQKTVMVKPEQAAAEKPAAKAKPDAKPKPAAKEKPEPKPKAEPKPKPEPKPKAPAKPDKPAAHGTVLAALDDPKSADPATLAAALKVLTVPELKGYAKTAGVGAGKLKAQTVAALLAYFSTAAAEPPPAAAEVAAGQSASTGKVGKGDTAGVEKLVAAALQEKGDTASATAMFTGTHAAILAAIADQTDGTVGTDEVASALDTLAEAETGVPNGPNPALSAAARPDLTQEEETAVREYTGSAYHTLNRDLRQTGTPPKKYGPTHAALQAAFDKAPRIKPPVTVVRGMQLDDAAKATFLAAVTAADQSAKPLELHGYVSTATTPDGKPLAGFAGNVTMVIDATHGLDLKPHSVFPLENELLLNHGARFKVMGTHTDPSGNVTVRLAQLHPSEWAGAGETVAQPQKSKPAAKPAAPAAAPPKAAPAPAKKSFWSKLTGQK